MSTERRIKVYTRTGDKGTSSLYNGERRDKTDLVFEALGASDELNSHIGLAVYACNYNESNGEKFKTLCSRLTEIQSRLLDVGSSIATPIDNSSNRKLERVKLPENMTTLLEEWIDEMDSELPPLKNFILPGGHSLSSSHLQVARAVSRRFERRVVALPEVNVQVQTFANRLSDFFFVAARYASHLEGAPESVYKKQ